MERLNSEGVLRAELGLTLKDRRKVMSARKINSCLLCRRLGVNDSGLCEICYGMLDGTELKLAERWLSGQGP